MKFTRQAIRSVLDHVKRAPPDQVELFMILATHDGEDSRVVRAHVGREVGQFFLDNVKSALGAKLAHEDLDISEYEPLLNPDAESILCEEIANVPKLDFIIREIARSDLPTFSRDDVRFLESYAIRITKDVVAFKKYSPTKLLQEHKFIAILGEDGTFTRLKGTAAALDRTIDCITSRTGVFILSSAVAFESIFAFTAMIEAFVADHAEDLSKLGLVIDVQPLAELCATDQYKQKKLFRILNRPELLKKLNPKAIAEAAKRRHLDLEFDAGGHAIIDTPQQARDFLKLLDEDFFSGEWTGQEYGANSKQAR